MTMPKAVSSGVFMILLMASVSVASNVTRGDRPPVSMGDILPNVLPIARVTYKENTLVNVYANKANDFNPPRQWSFYYEPPLLPTAAGLTRRGNQLRVSIIVGDDDLHQKVLTAVKAKYEDSVSALWRSWTIAPLMIDHILSYVTKDAARPTKGVHPCRLKNPKQLMLNLRFGCKNNDHAEKIRQEIMNGDLVIELGVKYAAMKTVETNHIAITADQLREIGRKTSVDAKYLTRRQSKNFTSRYVENLKKLVYIENEKSVLLLGVQDVEKRFNEMFERGLLKIDDIEVEAELFKSIWSPDDFKPDVITNELNRRFTVVKCDSGSSGHKVLEMKNMDSKNAKYAGSLSGFGISAAGEYANGGSSQNAFKNGSSFDEFSRTLSQNGLNVELKGKIIKAKSFNVIKLEDLISKLEMTMKKKVEIANKMQRTVFYTVNIDGIHKQED